MSARPFHPKMGRRPRPAHEVPGWVLIAVAVLLVLATAWTEGATPGTMAALFHVVGQVLLALLVAVGVIAVVGVWVLILAACWRALDEDTKGGPR